MPLRLSSFALCLCIVSVGVVRRAGLTVGGSGHVHVCVQVVRLLTGRGAHSTPGCLHGVAVIYVPRCLVKLVGGVGGLVAGFGGVVVYTGYAWLGLLSWSVLVWPGMVCDLGHIL